ncbi:MAG: peptide deformylase [Leptospiraceae bacterium]|nr:peptide deformylase [Leptospiraceae bacterium]MDW8307380.1 peptide deformylase [Leptospiraceae bacterium]
MAVRKILTIADPRLYQVSEPVTKFDRKLRDLARDLFDSMYAAGGVGLAAVQIGVLKRIMVIDLLKEGFYKAVFVNPVLIEKSQELQQGEEGCLSVPGLSLPLARPKWVKVAYQDLMGKEHTIEAEMLMARALLHEMDHLDGKVFVDQLEPDLRLSVEEDIALIKKGAEPRHYKVPPYRRKAS